MKPREISRLDWMMYKSIFVAGHFLGQKKSTLLLGSSKERLLNKISRSLKATKVKEEHCEVHSAPIDFYPEDFNKISSRPIVFRKAALDWDCCKKWNFDYLKNNYGDTKVTLNDNKGLIDKNNPQDFIYLKLSDYIDAMKNGSLKYLKFDRNIINENPVLKKDIGLGWLKKFWFKGAFREEIVLFMSGKDTLTPIHSAPSSNFFIQVHGRKKWTLYPPEDQLYLDVKSNRSYYYYSEADPDNINSELFPLQKYATKYEITLEKGDILWVPPFTWHHVYNLEPSIGISYRFLSLAKAFENSKTLMSLIFFATRPFFLKHIYMSAFHKKTAIFTRSDKEKQITFT